MLIFIVAAAFGIRIKSGVESEWIRCHWRYNRASIPGYLLPCPADACVTVAVPACPVYASIE